MAVGPDEVRGADPNQNRALETLDATRALPLPGLTGSPSHHQWPHQLMDLVASRGADGRLGSIIPLWALVSDKPRRESGGAGRPSPLRVGHRVDKALRGGTAQEHQPPPHGGCDRLRPAGETVRRTKLGCRAAAGEACRRRASSGSCRTPFAEARGAAGSRPAWW